MTLSFVAAYGAHRWAPLSFCEMSFGASRDIRNLSRLWSDFALKPQAHSTKGWRTNVHVLHEEKLDFETLE